MEAAIISLLKNDFSNFMLIVSGVVRANGERCICLAQIYISVDQMRFTLDWS